MTKEEILAAFKDKGRLVQVTYPDGSSDTYVDRASFDRVVEMLVRAIEQRDNWINRRNRDAFDRDEIEYEGRENEQLLSIAEGKRG